MTKEPRKINVDELRRLGFSEAAIEEAVKREQKGLLDVEVPADLVDRIKENIDRQEQTSNYSVRDALGTALVCNTFKYFGLAAMADSAIREATDKPYVIPVFFLGAALYLIGTAIPTAAALLNCRMSGENDKIIYQKLERVEQKLNDLLAKQGGQIK